MELYEKFSVTLITNFKSFVFKLNFSIETKEFGNKFQWGECVGGHIRAKWKKIGFKLLYSFVLIFNLMNSHRVIYEFWINVLVTSNYPILWETMLRMIRKVIGHKGILNFSVLCEFMNVNWIMYLIDKVGNQGIDTALFQNLPGPFLFCRKRRSVFV